MATAGRKPKPTHLKVLTNNPGKRPLNKNEPEPDIEIPSPPDFLSNDALIEWGKVTEQLYILGLLTRIDRSVISAYCQAYGRWAEAERLIGMTGLTYKSPKTGFMMQSPYLAVANKAMEQMCKYAAEFGMTPSARSRVQANPPKEKKKKGFAGL